MYVSRMAALREAKFFDKLSVFERKDSSASVCHPESAVSSVFYRLRMSQDSLAIGTEFPSARRDNVYLPLSRIDDVKVALVVYGQVAWSVETLCEQLTFYSSLVLNPHESVVAKVAKPNSVSRTTSAVWMKELCAREHVMWSSLGAIVVDKTKGMSASVTHPNTTEPRC